MWKKTYTVWWQAFNPACFKKQILLGLALLSLSVYGKAQNNYPDFRNVCAAGIGSDIYLSWSPLSDTCGGFQKLYIYGRTDGLQPFKLIDSVSSINQNQYIHFGAKTVSTAWGYFLVFKFLCSGDSAYSKTVDIDFNQPNISVIDSVSVDINTGKIVIGWSPNPAPDLLSYVIWTSQGVNNTPLDTINTTIYNDPSSSPSGGVQSYTLTAVDSCWNQSVISTVHRSMFLQSVYDTCKASINLSWSAYVGWTNILGYDIYAKNGDSSFKIVGSTNSSQPQFSFSNFKPGDTLEFFIRAKEGNKGFTSSSNKAQVQTRKRNFSSRNYISYATVLDSSTIELKLLADPSADTKSFTIYRKKEQEGFLKQQDIVYDKTSNSIIYTDKNVVPYLYSYQYRFISEDICDNPLDTSNVAKTILLSITPEELNNNLEWSTYKLWDAGVNQYSIYRGFDFGNGFTWNILNTTGGNDSLYQDNNFPNDAGIAGTCYYIEATESTGNKYGELAKSKSNTVCLVEDATIFFPNAFAPDKINTLFLPKGTNIDYRRTNMLIYARNGQLMKKIDDIHQGWDGTNLNGDLCVDGVYLYLCEVYGLNEKKYNFKGTVHLLR